jgi:23S rRNA G2069 N7-methylase RlmK/C1962 C5-methylase RlmI
VACCCSSYVSPEDFLGSIIFGARQAGRRVRILASRGQGPDHPWIPAMEQTAYLKVHLLQVL